MSLPSSRILFPASVFIVVMMLASVIAACGTSGVPPTSPTQAEITWPFGLNDGQWAIVNGYGGGDHHDYTQFALDFARCFPDKVNIAASSCDLAGGWDTVNTDGKIVYSPVAGHVRWIYDAGDPSASPCRSLGIELSDAPGYYIELAHIEQLVTTQVSYRLAKEPEDV